MAHLRMIGLVENNNFDGTNWSDSYRSRSLNGSIARITSSSSSSENAKPDVYTQEAAVNAAASMPKILGSGRKVFGPPPGWNASTPSFICELFLAYVPHGIEELLLSGWLHRFGTIYEFRLMTDSRQGNRGYGFLRFSKESEALAAYELLNFRYHGSDRLVVFRSMGKNRFHISNIPKELPVDVVKAGLKKIFPQSMDVLAYESKRKELLGKLVRNRGYAFIEFCNHEDAAEAKNSFLSGQGGCMWNVDLKMQWAKPVSSSSTEGNGMMNGPLQKGVSKWRRYHVLSDFNAKLRLLCLANDCNIPVVLYGRNFPQYGIQYGAILLKRDLSGESCCIIMEVAVERVHDIHVLMCEVAVLIIEKEAGFPQKNYVLKVQHNHAELVVRYSSSHVTNSGGSRLSVTNYYFRHSNSILELAESLKMLAMYSSQELLSRYKRSFLISTPNVSPSLNFNEQQHFPYKIHAILPKFRNNQPLNGHLNDAEINLILDAGQVNDVKNDYTHVFMYSQVLPLRSQRSSNFYELRYVGLQQGFQFYHPLQRINTPPIWIAGHTYQESLYN